MENDFKMEEDVTVPPAVSRERTYLAWSIFNTIFCCTSIGIITIVFSLQTETANLIGNSARAKARSRLVKKLNIASSVIGIVFIILVIIIVVKMPQFFKPFLPLDQLKRPH
ncbi:hypothetical protein KOW79_021831 [Hemibagrus wyckioides]|uniref:Interferon-induced transmembrane protein n=1 Tax=Hemibagrus wyckioides TaxID=337641 RepID=A0A9D3N1B1_9TELE|nr:hypothetical protein KOW79_021831 [Hemibagrus wyckioides]